MKILLISSNSSGTGGGEYYLVYLASALIQFGHEVHALISKHDYMMIWADKLIAAGAKVHRLPLSAHLDRPLRFIQAQLDRPQQDRIRQLCLALNPDIIHTNHQYDEDGLDLPLAVAGVAPHIATIHLPMCATKHQRPLGRWRGQFLRNWYQRHPYAKIFVSAHAKQEFTSYYPNTGTSFAIQNGLWSGTLAPSVQSRSGYQSPFTLGFVGRLNFQKDPMLLAKTWVLVNQQLPECQLLIAGDGEMRSQLEAYLSAEAPERAWKILGWIKDPKELNAIYAQIDVLVMTSLFEAAPLVLVEASTLGIPIIATEIPQLVEFQAQIPLLHFVAERNPSAIAHAILDEYHQQQLLKAATPQALQQIREYFSLNRMAQSTIEAYHDTIRNAHPTR